MRKLLVIMMLAIAAPSLGSVLFFEDFEGDLSRWTGKGNNPTGHHGVIVPDTLEGDHALAFYRLNSAGDIFTKPGLFSTTGGGEFKLSYNYRGICGTGDCGGFIGFSYDYPGRHVWLAGTRLPYNDIHLDDGSWEYFEIVFTPRYPTIDFHLMLEDFSASYPRTHDAFFDNIKLERIPEPATALLLGLGAGLLAGVRRLRKRR